MEREVGPLELSSEDAFPALPRVGLPTLAGAVLLPLATLLATGAREDEASALAAARACTAAERTWAA